MIGFGLLGSVLLCSVVSPSPLPCFASSRRRRFVDDRQPLVVALPIHLLALAISIGLLAWRITKKTL